MLTGHFYSEPARYRLQGLREIPAMDPFQQMKAIARAALITVERAMTFLIVEAEAVLAAAGRTGTMTVAQIARLDSESRQNGRPGTLGAGLDLASIE